MPNVYDELKRAQLELLSSDPTPGVTGRVLYQTTQTRPKIDTGTAIKPILTFGDSIGLAIVASKTGTYSAALTDNYIPCNANGGAFTVNLPAASTATNLLYVIKKTDTTFNAVTIDGNGAELVDGSATITLNTEGETVYLLCDGSAWQLLYRRIPSTWTAYTPTFTQIGTVSAVECVWRRSGDQVDLMIKFTAGTPGGGEARISLPSGLTSSGASKITSIRFVGPIVSNYTEAPLFVALAEPSVTYITIGYQVGGGTGGLTKEAGSSMFTAGQTYSLFCSVPINGWVG